MSEKNRIKKYFRKKKFKKSQVFLVLSVIMEKQAESRVGETDISNSVTSGDNYSNDFFNTGRIGRRNALPDILSCNCSTSTADLPNRLQSLTTADDPSKSNDTFSNSTNTTNNVTPSTSNNYNENDVNIT